MTQADKVDFTSLSAEDKLKLRLEAVRAAQRELTAMATATSMETLPPFVLLAYTRAGKAISLTGSTGTHGLLAFAIALLDELKECQTLPAIDFPLLLLQTIQQIELAEYLAEKEPRATHSAPESEQ